MNSSKRKSSFASANVLRRPGGPRRGDQTRSHPELGRQTPPRQWYFVSRHGRVGRRQARQERSLPLCNPSDLSKGQVGNRQSAIGSRQTLSSRLPFAHPRLPASPDAGWSSPVARQAHNLKVTGSNPVPATKLSPLDQSASSGLTGFFMARATTHPPAPPTAAAEIRCRLAIPVTFLAAVCIAAATNDWL